ncbi:2' O-ribose methyltransferase [Friedmanniomyces endolithicus]|uniref:rRNA methyltransferase 2, mitochondrial n=1 Tax=Friedmanniomyces endolithicus TaxID=329885 RepID=A0AAN6L1T3_9PEZI|nr:2' O-ribose methyltransferase [Friedmanniomyces endolithicus]KAK0922937.1 2' O-ribose methyltransferase [Friedmanniomyces endolithicus]KAK1014236.1 2' O-ribose methyltransferase [Friedmanniomyces endolithicus]KAK1040797.1 2' O-ribose methyltransferase [Friedmanniomyces endolithicus]
MLVNANRGSRQSAVSVDQFDKMPSLSLTLQHPYRIPTLQLSAPGHRHTSSASSTRWKIRQSTDSYAREAKVAGLKSRAAFKLLEINAKYRLFHPGDTVVDLGYAPGSWSQVAVNRTAPGGRVVGIDVIPAQPPRGVSTLQGDFLSPAIREEMRAFVADPERGRARVAGGLSHSRGEGGDLGGGVTEEQLDEESKGVVELGKAATEAPTVSKPSVIKAATANSVQKAQDLAAGRMVNVVLSDMCEPWPLATSTWVKSVSNPWRRMMNTSGMAFRDHAGSMDLCLAALEFAYDTLATSGNFLCKFYQGGEDQALEARLKKLFEKVYRIKPDSSRKESKEAYLVGLRRRPGVVREAVLGEGCKFARGDGKSYVWLTARESYRKDAPRARLETPSHPTQTKCQH